MRDAWQQLYNFIQFVQILEVVGVKNHRCFGNEWPIPGQTRRKARGVLLARYKETLV